MATRGHTPLKSIKGRVLYIKSTTEIETAALGNRIKLFIERFVVKCVKLTELQRIPSK